MPILLLDTAFDYLAIGLVVHDKLVINHQEAASKKQSEIAVARLDELFKAQKMSPKDISSLCVTIGPGSYTGLRIALTIAKVLTRFNSIDLYSVSTLRAYCPLDGLKNMVMMDARSNRVYAAAYQDHLELLKPCVLPLNEAEVMAQSMDSIYGNVDQGKVPKILESMWEARSEWTKVNDVDGLVPLYLKDDSAYGRP